jgi:hypothetical protein
MNGLLRGKDVGETPVIRECGADNDATRVINIFLFLAGE